MKKYKMVFIISAVILILYGISSLPLTEYLNSLTIWFQGFGIWAPLIYFAFFTLVSSWLFPVFLLSISAGILFGFHQGFIVISMGNLASCTMMFLLARYSGRNVFQKKLEQYPKTKRFEEAIEREGWKMIFMLRAVPILHMILLNIISGLSKMKLRQYLIGTWLGMFPMLLVYAYLGSLADNVTKSPHSFELSAGHNVILMSAGIFILIGFSIYMKRVMRKYVVPVRA